tara:strand:+ start:124 stop:642 length:519 start_codon:yes stop_codon:yes gene_type:complete
MKLAFTLIELLVVIALVGILAGVGWPNLAGWNCDQDARNNFESISQFMRTSQSEATNSNSTVLVRTTSSRNEVSQGVIRAYKEDRNDRKCVYSAANSRPIPHIIPTLTFKKKVILDGPVFQCFYPDGSADSGDYRFRKQCSSLISYGMTVFSATGLSTKMKFSTIRNVWEDL